MSQAPYMSSDEGNESEEKQPSHEYYGEIRGEYEDEEYEQNGEEYWYLQSPEQYSKARSPRSSPSSQPTSRESTVSEYRHHHHHGRKSIKKNIIGGIGYSISQEDTQFDDNQDLIDSLPDDISTSLIEYWQQMEEMYDPINENAFEGINKTHKKLLEYPDYFQEEFMKQLESPDERARVADQFKIDFNRVPLATRTNEQMKPILLKRISELLIKLEGITEEKYANTKRSAYKILSKGFLTEESERLARFFGTLLLAEADRFADTIKFINEHYYTKIAIELGMPHKVRWNEIMDIGLIKKKFICEHFREQCLLRELLHDGDSFKGTNTESSSDSDICGGGTRGQDMSLVCENEDDSTPTDTDAKMNGEMKLSLEFDNEEFLGEGGWDGFFPSSHRYSVLSGATVEKSVMGADRDEDSLRQEKAESRAPSSKPSSKKPSASDKMEEMKSEGGHSHHKDQRKASQASKSSKKQEGSVKKGNDDEEEEEGGEDEEVRKHSHYDYPEEYDEELEMDPHVAAAVPNPVYFDDEYPGEDDEFWEGEGDDHASYRTSKSTRRTRQSSVKFEEKPGYIRDFFWDSDPSKQDATVTSKTGKEKTECIDEGYFDQEELFDEEDVFYDQDEFFEKEVETPRKNAKENGNTQEPKELYFAIFGRETDTNSNVPLLNKLLTKWTSQRVVEHINSNTEMKKVSMSEFEVTEVNQQELELDEEEMYKTERGKSFQSSIKGVSPPTPPSTIKQADTNKDMIVINTMGLMGSGDGPVRHSFLDKNFSEGYGGLLLKLHPNKISDTKEHTSLISAHTMQQKRPLLECFINLQDEIWNGFEVAFREARMNITKVMASLKEVVIKSYPIERPKDPCVEEPDADELIAASEAIKEKYGGIIKQPSRALKAQKQVQLKDSSDGEEDIVEIEVERDETAPEQDEENEEEENNMNTGTPKSSFVELVPLQVQRNTSAELEILEQEQQEKNSSLADSSEQRLKKEKRVSIEESGSLKKASVHDSASGSNRETKPNGEDSLSAEEEKETDKKPSVADSVTAGETEKKPSVQEIKSPQSDVRTASTDRKSTYLERTPGDTDIRLPVQEVQDTPMGPSPEEQKLLKRAKHAMLKSKLQHWENTLDLEAERLARQLALIESHAQHEFRLLKELPAYIWDDSKSQAASVYMDDLKRDAEVGEVFGIATQYGSPLYGQFYIDRRDLMLLLKGNESAIPLKYTDEFMELSNSLSGKRRTKKSEFIELEE